ncbi:hypothetical protein BW247_12945 [Acidihalobacter ferrooxydans]|uniref:Uncharacterized protein n=1 Tax=Acidihalobacter ferrooxydans TaxID=1765967 RepID=A0A1P8UJ64_9GAMM|nr:hypothetical protein BW247_12945 [Acidihalobacter ferrooxydans]
MQAPLATKARAMATLSGAILAVVLFADVTEVAVSPDADAGENMPMDMASSTAACTASRLEL